MTRYYLSLALRGLMQHRALTALMVIAIGLGIAATMTGLTIVARYGSDAGSLRGHLESRKF